MSPQGKPQPESEGGPPTRASRAWTIPWWRVVAGAAAFVGLFVGYFRAFRQHLPKDATDPDDVRAALLLAFFVSLFTFFALLGLALVVQAAYHRQRLGTFAAGRGRLRDGAFAAVDGQAQPEGETLVAPLCGKRCLAYEYEVWIGSRWSAPRRGRAVTIGEEGSPRRSHHVGLAGIALAPTVVVGRHGRARLLGWAPLDQGFPVTWIEPRRDAQAARRLRELQRERPFERLTGVRGFRLIGRLFGLQASAGASLRQDWCFDARALRAEPKEVLVRERLLPLDAPAGASGLWSEAQGGLHGHVGRVGLELWSGSVAERQRVVLHKPLGQFAFMVLLALALHGVVALLWKSDEELAAERRRRALAGFDDAWGRRDLEGVRAALRAGADPDRRDHYGDTLLMNAARERGVEWVRLLLEAGAGVEANNSAWGRDYTALVGAAQRGREDVVALLLAAGARDFRVTERNGRPLPRDGGEPLAAVMAYYQAILDQDRAALERLRLDPLDPSAIDWGLWRRARPFERGVARGYVNDAAATLTLHANNGYGRPTAWAYHLARVTDERDRPAWRIAYEWEVR